MARFKISQCLPWIAFNDRNSEEIKRAFYEYFCMGRFEEEREAETVQEAAIRFITDYNNNFRYKPRAMVNADLREMYSIQGGKRDELP